MRWPESLALVAILILAAALRLGWPGVNSFAFDEAHLSLIALNMAQGGEFAQVGMPSSAGMPNLPAAAWVFSLPYLFSADPLVVTQFVGLLSVLSVVGVWWLARRSWGAWAGLVAALFYAASPYSILYSRNIWAQNLLPVLALAWAITAFLAVTRGRWWALVLHVFIAGFAFQVHFAGAALVLGSAYFFVRFRWWRYWLPVLAGGALVLLTLLPFVAEIACCRPDILDQYGTALGGETHYDLLGFRELLRVALAVDWGYLLLGDLQPPDSMLLAGVVAVVLLVGGVRLFPMLRGSHRESAVLAEMIIVWLLCAPLFFIRHSTPVYVHYVLVALPALSLLAGAATKSHNQPYLRLPLTAVVLTVAAVWSVQIAQGLALAGTTGTPNGLGTPLKFTRSAAYSLPDDAPVWFFSHGDDPAVDGEAAVFEVLWWGREHTIVQGESLLVLPGEPAYLMSTIQYIQAWEELDAGGLAQETLSFPRREGLRPFVATHYEGDTRPDGFTLLENPVTLADGAQLIGWKARMVGPRLRISTLWRVVGTPDPGVYQQFHHLYAGDDDEPLAISDVPVSAQHWRSGDHLVVMGDFFVDDLPDESQSFMVDVGHYTLPDLQRIPRADGTDGLLRLGPLTIDTRTDDD